MPTISSVRSSPKAPRDGTPRMPITPSPVGAGDGDPRPAIRQPLTHERSSAIDESPKVTIWPTSGTPRVRRWRLPTTRTSSTAAQTVAATRRLPDCIRSAASRPLLTSPVIRSSPRPIWPRSSWLSRALPRCMFRRTSASETRRNPRTCLRASRSAPSRLRFHVQACTTSPTRFVRPATSA